MHAGKLTGQQTNGKNFSTIPSKFETTLFTGNKERDGFGSRAHRFVDVENDLPGPGTYNDHESKILDHKVYSKKGLGSGFVSKTKRESGFKATSSAPGPGNYERGGSFYEAVKQSNRANRSGSTSTFKPPTQRSVMVASDPLPGPTDYNIARSFDGADPRWPRCAAVSASLQHAAVDAGSKWWFSSRSTSTIRRNWPAPTRRFPAAFRSTVPIVGG